MRRYADPERCPDCGSRLPTGDPVCRVCHLDLGGELGLELFTTLGRADELLARMRQPVGAAVAPGAAPRAQAAPPAAPAPPAPGRPAPAIAPAIAPAQPRAGWLRAASVPKILLTLGAVCLLVAALVFLAVNWSRLGVGGRTATLVMFTLTTGALTRWMAGRGLRAATEALGVVTLGLLTLDLYGADNAGWFGDLSEAGVTTLVGVSLGVAGLGAVTLLARSAAGGFTSGEVAAALGASMVSLGLAAQQWGSAAGRLLLAVVLVLALTLGVWRLVREGSNLYRTAAWLFTLVLALDWLVLIPVGLEQLGGRPAMDSAWGGLGVWPLVAAGAVALLVSALRWLPRPVRLLSAAAGSVPLGLAVLAPALDEPVTTVIPAVAALTAVLVVLMAVAPAPWGVSGAAAAALCGLGLSVEALRLAGLAAVEYVTLASAEWRGTVDGRVGGAAEAGAERWLLLLCTTMLLALLWGAARLVRPGSALVSRVAVKATVATVALAGVATMLLYPVPVWAVLVAGLSLSIAAALPALVRDDVASAAFAGVGLLGTVLLSWYDEQLTAVALLVALGLVAAVHARTRRVEVAAASAASVAILVGGLAWTLGAVLDVDAPWAGVAGLVALAALVLGRPYLPLAVSRHSVDTALEVAAALVAVPLAAVAIEAAPAREELTWLAIHLTVAGVAVTLLALLRPGRRQLTWFGGLLLAAATWARLSDLGVDAPEPYTLPSAAALLAVGLLRLRRDPSGSTHTALGAGLALALVPSLLWVLIDPTGVRPLLLGLGCLALVVAGAQLRWAAPLIYGAVVGLSVVLREAAPYLGGTVPRWALIGAAGAVLIAMGVTWEQRLRDARLVSTYVRALR